MICDTQRQFWSRAGGVTQRQCLCPTSVEPWLPSPASASACSDHSVEFVCSGPVGAWECSGLQARRTAAVEASQQKGDLCLRHTLCPLRNARCNYSLPCVLFYKERSFLVF